MSIFGAGRGEKALTTPSDKCWVALGVFRAADAWMQHHPYMLPRGAFDDPLMWWGALVAFIVIAHVVTPAVNAWDQLTYFSIARDLVVLEVGAFAVHRLCLWRGADLMVHTTPWWRSVIFVNALAFALSCAFFDMKKEDASGSHS